MTRYGHIWVGALSAADVFNIHIPPTHLSLTQTTMILFVCVVFGAFFPDIDMWFNGFKYVPYKQRTLWSHRGWTHHILLPFFLLLTSFFLHGVYAKCVVAFTFGIITHLITDILSPLGIPYGTKYSQRIGFNVYRTGKVSEIVFTLAVSVILLIPVFTRSVYAAPPRYDNKTFLRSYYNESVHIKSEYNTKQGKKMLNNIRNKVIFYQDNNTINKEAKRLAKQSYKVFKTKRLPQVSNNIWNFLRQQGVSPRSIIPSPPHKQALASNSFIYIFMSSSVPFDVWRNYAFAIDKLRREGQGNIGMVMRGFIGGAKHVMPTMKFIQRVLTAGNVKLRVPIEIDPFLFRMYNIKRVPIFVYAKNVNVINPRLSQGEPVNLKGQITAYKVVGDWSFSYALKKLYRESGDIALLKLYNDLNRSWFEEGK